mgnify:CR=1 FL=1
MKRNDGPEFQPTTSNAAGVYRTPQLFRYGSLADLTASGAGTRGEETRPSSGEGGMFRCVYNPAKADCSIRP